MKRLFIYYSLTGNGDYIANYLKNNNIDIRKVDAKVKIPKSFFFRMIIGGYYAMKNYRAKLINFDNNIDEYDEIIIGSPIWNDRLSTPINSVLDVLDLKNKKVTFVFYSGSGSSEHASNYVKEKFGNVKIINIKDAKNCDLDKYLDFNS